MSLLVGKNINFSYDSKLILNNVNVTIENNEIVALLGASGVGKSTLLNILAGLLKPDSGNVVLKDKDITYKSGYVGYMFQKDLLLPFKTMIDNVMLPLIIKKRNKYDAYQIASSYLEIFKLVGYEHYYPHKLSGGMKQRVAFLRTFLYNNEIMLLDEPFSALDAITKEELYIWFKQMITTLNTSVLFITHDIDEALKIANKIYVIGSTSNTINEIKITGNSNIDFSLTNDFLQYKKAIIKLLNK